MFFFFFIFEQEQKGLILKSVIERNSVKRRIQIAEKSKAKNYNNKK